MRREDNTQSVEVGKTQSDRDRQADTARQKHDPGAGDSTDPKDVQVEYPKEKPVK